MIYHSFQFFKMIIDDVLKAEFWIQNVWIPRDEYVQFYLRKHSLLLFKESRGSLNDWLRICYTAHVLWNKHSFFYRSKIEAAVLGWSLNLLAGGHSAHLQLVIGDSWFLEVAEVVAKVDCVFIVGNLPLGLFLGGPTRMSVVIVVHIHLHAFLFSLHLPPC